MIDNIKKIAYPIENFNWNDENSSLVAISVFLKRINKNFYLIVNRSSNTRGAKN